MNLYQQKLKDADKAWGTGSEQALKDHKEGKKSGGGFKPLPPGKYQAQLIEGTIGESKASKRLQAVLVWRVVGDGEQKGLRVWDYNGLEQEQNRYYMNRKILMLTDGKECPTGTKSLEQILGKLVSVTTVAEITVVQKGDGPPNVYVDSLVGGTSTPQAEGEIAPKEEEAVDIVVGLKVRFEDKAGNVYEGIVKALHEEAGKASVTVEGRPKPIKVPFAKLQALEVPPTTDDSGVPEDPEDIEF